MTPIDLWALRPLVRPSCPPTARTLLESFSLFLPCRLVGHRLARYRGQRAGRRQDHRAGINDSKHADSRDPPSSIAIASLMIRSGYVASTT
jgi:hypothetical protein